MSRIQDNVIQVVIGINNSGLVNDKNVVGIIDRDRRVLSEITNLKKSNLHVLEVAEVENLFILPEIINAKMVSQKWCQVLPFAKLKNMMIS